MTLYLFNTEPITYQYPGGPPLLNQVQFRGQPGSLTVLIGPNGAGKSTLLKILAGTIPVSGLKLHLTVQADVGAAATAPAPETAPRDGQALATSGTVALHALSLRERARYVAYLPQSVVAPDDLRVEEIVALGRYPHQRWWSLPSAAEAGLVRSALAEVDAAELFGRRFNELSGGEQQSVLLASVLAQAAPVLLLDEPGKALDIHHQAVLFGRLKSMAEQGRTVVAITHDLNIASHFAGRIILMQGGHLIADGTPAEVLTTARLQAVYGPEVRVVADPADPTGQAPIVIPQVLASAGATHGR